MKVERVQYLDAIKGVAILLVVFCHYVMLPADTYIGNIVMSLAWVAVPCFIMISGALLHASTKFSWTKYVKKVLSLYVVMSIWKFIYLFVLSYFEKPEISKVELIKYLFLFGNIEGINTSVMWYMVAFLVALLIFPITHFLINSSKQGKILLGFMFAICFVSGILIPSINFILDIICKEVLKCNVFNIAGIRAISPFVNYDNIICYFILGAFLYYYRVEITKKLRQKHLENILPMLLLFSGLIGTLFMKYLSTGSFKWENIYFENGYAHLSTFLMVLGFYLFFAAKERRVSCFLAKYVGRYTMGIFYLHFLILNVASRFVYPFFMGEYSFLLNCIKTIVVSILCIVITKILRKTTYIKTLV